MTDPIQPKPMMNNLPQAHRVLVEKLAAETRPSKATPSTFVQWLVWLGFALAMVAATLSLIGPQFELMEKLTDPVSGGFLLLAFTLSAFCAWMGIASSKPDYTPRAVPPTLAALLVLFLFSMPFFYFDSDSLSKVLTQNMADGWFCARTVIWVAIPSWAMLGWLASRNASFYPGWTGAWLGASAFLLGAGTIQLHCAHWQTCHMLLDHLLPMAVFLFIPIWLGSYWFSRWRK